MTCIFLYVHITSGCLGCSHGWHRSFLSLFIPQSSPAARVYSNQGLTEQCQKAFRSQIWILLSSGCSSQSPSSDFLHGQRTTAAAVDRVAETITFHCRLVAAGAHRSKVSQCSHFLLQHKSAMRDPTKGRRPRSPLHVCLSLPCFHYQMGTEKALEASCLSSLFFFVFNFLYFSHGWRASGGR